jgi:hypothetical protein
MILKHFSFGLCLEECVGVSKPCQTSGPRPRTGPDRTGPDRGGTGAGLRPERSAALSNPCTVPDALSVEAKYVVQSGPRIPPSGRHRAGRTAGKTREIHV